MAIRVVVEIGPKRTFASALDWPGWSRSGRAEADALRALLVSADRYAAVASAAGLELDAPTSVDAFEVVERLTGNATTDFGAPGKPASSESEALDDRQLGRLTALLRASWAVFDRAVATAGNRELRTGPRGGGRAVTEMVEHVVVAERAYLSKLGSLAPADDRLAAVHAAVLATLTARVRGEELPRPARTRVLWPPRYAARRIAWHALDHAWEIDDRLP
ncbi:MAG TPA: hypothetical protein VM253_08520 [Candidatus Limnocylindrales bacterium]|nr:hypothetical protein [Candidatus Limnocylindrales bacterium]